jgi:hypothetical protein
MQVSSLSHVTSIVAGDQHTLLLVQQQQQQHDTTHNGSCQVYACGRGTFGATGLGITDNVCRPSCISALEGQHVVQLAAGRQHSVALTVDGQLYTWGAGELGQLGLGCSCCSRHEQDLQQQQQQKSLANDVLAASWQLPQAQLSPKQLQSLPWPSSCPILFVVAGGDHTIAVVQLDSTRSSGTSVATNSLDSIAEDAASSVPVVAAGAEVQNSLPHQQQQAHGATAMEIDGAVSQQQAAAAVLWPPPEHKQQQQQCARLAVPKSGPDPQLRPYGANLLPLQLPPVMQLATAAAAEAAATRRAVGAISPDPGGTGGSSSSTHGAAAAAAAAGLGPQVTVSTAAAARDDTARAASSSDRPSPVVVDLAHAVLDVFSSPGLLLQLLKADSSVQQQQQQQKSLLSHGLDLERIESLYTLLLKSYAREVVGALGAASVRLLQDLPDSRGWSSGASRETVAVLFVLLQNPLNSDVHGLGAVLLGLLTALVLKLNSCSLRLLLSWLAELKAEVFGARVVRPVQALLTRLAK